MRKGNAVISMLGIAITAVILVIFTVQIIPRTVEDVYSQISRASAEVVSRNLAGLITISAAAPNNIIINYQPSKNYFYNIKIVNRIVDVEILTEKINIFLPEKIGMKGRILTKTGVDSKCYDTTEINCQFNNVNNFIIKKWVDNGYVINVIAK